jgi:RNA polymerase sigma factor (sigma-70 family)
MLASMPTSARSVARFRCDEHPHGLTSRERGEWPLRDQGNPTCGPARRATRKGPERVRGKAYGGLHDGQLVELVAEKDGDALEALYDRYGRAAFSLARRILAEETLAQDVVQEVFLSLWRNAHRFDAGRGTVATYLLSMTHHRAVDVVRREEKLRRWRTSDEVLDFEPDPKGGVEDEVEAGQRRAEVRAALAVLPPAQREALLLAYFGGYTQREVAALVGIPLGTVKTRMAAGMRKLKQALQDAGREEHPWTHR